MLGSGVFRPLKIHKVLDYEERGVYVRKTKADMNYSCAGALVFVSPPAKHIVSSLEWMNRRTSVDCASRRETASHRGSFKMRTAQVHVGGRRGCWRGYWRCVCGGSPRRCQRREKAEAAAGILTFPTITCMLCESFCDPLAPKIWSI